MQNNNLQNKEENDFYNKVKFNEQMIEILEYSRENFIPTVLNSTAKFLFDIVSKEKPKHILEIGSAIGYSAILMLKASEQSKITTIEINKERSEIALQNFKKANVESRVQLINNDSKIALEDLKEQSEKFDFVFMDGAKGDYLLTIESVKDLINKGGIVCIDDCLYMYTTYGEGDVPHKHRAMINKLRNFNKYMQNNNMFSVEYYNIDEGIIIATKKWD